MLFLKRSKKSGSYRKCFHFLTEGTKSNFKHWVSRNKITGPQIRRRRGTNAITQHNPAVAGAYGEALKNCTQCLISFYTTITRQFPGINVSLWLNHLHSHFSNSKNRHTKPLTFTNLT